jgi:hypothetical protein
MEMHTISVVLHRVGSVRILVEMLGLHTSEAAPRSLVQMLLVCVVSQSSGSAMSRRRWQRMQHHQVTVPEVVLTGLATHQRCMMSFIMLANE